MFYYVYKITNTVNGKYYIGAHQSECLDDGYLGSGKWLKNAQRKYGLDLFTKEIIKFCDNELEMYALEAELVTEDLVMDDQCYNLIVGGHGGWNAHNTDPANSQFRKAGAAIRNSLPVKDETRRKISERCSSRWQSGKMDHLRPMMAKAFKGKTHTEETKRRIGEANRKNSGEANSQFGSCWIYHEEQKLNMKVRQSDLENFLNADWRRGRKMKFD